MAQDVLIKTFSNVSSFKGHSNFSTWLYSITHNHCTSQVVKTKKGYTGKSCVDNVSMSYDINTEEYEERCRKEELEVKLDEYLGRLPEFDRKILELKYRNNYSVKDLQKEFEMSASAVKMRLLRARQKIERILADKEAA